MASLRAVSGPAEDAIRAQSRRSTWRRRRDEARTHRARAGGTAVTRDGEVFRGAHRVEGGARDEARSILTTKREIKELRERADAEDATLVRLREEAAGLDVAIAAAESAIASLQAELHRQEKAIVGFDLQVTTAGDAAERVARKQDQIATRAPHRRRGAARQERARRRRASRSSASRPSSARRTSSCRRRSASCSRRARRPRNQSRVTAEAKAAHAALVERTQRARHRSPAARRCGARARAARRRPRPRSCSATSARREELRAAIAASERQLDEGLRTFDDLRDQVRTADEASQALRGQFDAQEAAHPRGAPRRSRRCAPRRRSSKSQRATAEADLAHLAASCVETVQATLDEVAAEVARAGAGRPARQPEGRRRHARAPPKSKRRGRPRRVAGSRAAAPAAVRARSRPTRWSPTCAPRSSGWAPST